MRGPYIGQPVTRIRVDRTRRTPVDAALLGHLDYLVDVGMTYYMIARAAGVTSTTVRNLHGRRASASTISVRGALMAVTPRPSKHQAYVLPFATRRRLDGLAVMGWSTSALAEKLGVDRTWFRQVRRAESISWNSHVAVAEVFAELETKDGGNTRTKAWAKRQGLVHPMLWDDIDDYDDTPALAEPMSDVEYRRGEIRHFRRMGLGDEQIAAKFGITIHGLQQWELRHGQVAA